MVLRLGHVFDLLNQMALMEVRPWTLGAAPEISVFLWSGSSSEEQIKGRPVPPIASLRAMVVDPFEEGADMPALSIVFEDGLHIQFPVDPGIEQSPEEQREFISQTAIDSDGNVLFADGHVMTKESLHQLALDRHFGRIETQQGRAASSPVFKY